VFISESMSLTTLASILGSSVKTMRRMDELVLNANAYTVSCTGAVSYYNIVRAWSIQDISLDARALDNVRSASQNPAIFKLSAYSLRAGAIYKVTLNATSLSAGSSAKVSITVKVQYGSIVAVLAGGNARFQRSGEPFTLDASKTSDEDVLALKGAAAGLSFSWGCVQLTPEFKPSCPLNYSNPVPDKLTAVGGTEAAGTTSRITVTAFDERRTSSAYVDVTLTLTPTPEVSITSGVASLSNINVNRNMLLVGSVKVLTACTAQWSVDDNSVALAAASLTPTSANVAPLSKPMLLNLLVSGGTLPERSSLVFTLSCGDAHTSVTVTTNGAPLRGQFSVEPSEGIELATSYTFSATQWTDPDLPLTYQFGFESGTSLLKLVIVSKSELSYSSSSLPAGLPEIQYRLNCSLEVFDSVGATARVTVAVVVRKATTGYDSGSAVLLLVSSSTGSVDDVKRVLSVATTVINSVNCTAAPNCTSLHRNRCGATSHVCGSCLDGYIGDIGDQNTPCMLLNQVVINTTVYCTSWGDCQPWEFCNGADRTCTLESKSCPGNCSSNGRCIYVTTNLGQQLTAEQCKINNQHCAATCSCFDQYSGRLCEISNADLKSRRAVRSTLISSLQNLTSIDDINDQSVLSWSASLYSLALRPFELSTSDAAALMSIANFTLNQAGGMEGISVAPLTGVLQALDTVSSVRKYNYNPNDYDSEHFNTSREAVNNTAAAMIPVIEAFAQLAANSMVVGQEGLGYQYENFRLATSLHALSTGDNITVPALQTDLEKAGAAAVSAVRLLPAFTANSTTSSVAVDMVTVFPRAYAQDTSMYDADPIYVRITSNTGEKLHTYASSIEFTLARYQFGATRNYRAVGNVTSQCLGNKTEEVYYRQCPGSGVEVVHNCTGIRELLSSSCPQLRQQCADLTVITGELRAASQCTLVSADEQSTTCSCDLTQKAIATPARRLDMLDDALAYTGVANVATISIFVGESFTSTIGTAQDFNSAADLAQVLIVIYLFATIWGAGLLLVTLCVARSDPRIGGLLFKKAHAGKVASTAEPDVGDKATERFLAYIEEVIPPVYAEGRTTLQRVLAELCAHHRYLTLFTLGDGRISFYSKTMIILKLLTVDTMQMFLLAVLYDLQCADDDGSCVGYLTEEQCLARTSILDSTQTYCQWTYNDAQSEFLCSYQIPHNSAWTFIYIFVFVSVTTSLFNVPIDYLFGICCAPLHSDVAEPAPPVNNWYSRSSRVGSQMLRGARRLSSTAVQPVLSAVSTVKQRVSIGFRGEAGLVDASTSLELRRKHSVAATLLPRVSLQAGIRQRHRSEVDGRVRILVQRRRQSAAESSKGMKTYRAAEQLRLVETLNPDEHISGSLARLVDDITAQRLLLASGAELMTLFDTQWGVELLCDDPSVYDVSPAARSCIAEAIQESDEIADKTCTLMPRYTAQYAGLTILHLFVQDLLGRTTSAARIFDSKFDESYAQTSAVNRWQISLALASILLCNAFFIYYTLLKAFVKGHAWQWAFMVACVVQMLVEILLNETLECLWLNYWVPSLVRREVSRVVDVLKRVAGELTNDEAVLHSKAGLFLNASPYLFVSNKVAARNAELLESVLVLSYESILPGELASTWPHCMAAAELEQRRANEEKLRSAGLAQRAMEAVMTAAATTVAVLAAGVQWSGTLKFDYQRVVIRMVQPIVFSGLTMLCYFSTSSAGGFAVFCIVVCSVLGVVAYMRYRGRKLIVNKKIDPVVPIIDLEQALDTGLDVALNLRGSSGSSRSNYSSNDQDASHASRSSDSSDIYVSDPSSIVESSYSWTSSGQSEWTVGTEQAESSGAQHTSGSSESVSFHDNSSNGHKSELSGSDDSYGMQSLDINVHLDGYGDLDPRSGELQNLADFLHLPVRPPATWSPSATPTSTHSGSEDDCSLTADPWDPEDNASRSADSSSGEYNTE
jgi:hypothetical protein